MKHRNSKVSKFNRAPAARKALVLGLARSLFTHEKIETTLAKAKAARPEAEKMLTIARTNTLANRRRLISKLQDTELVEKLLTEIGPRLGSRTGGYTRIQRSFVRKGDMTQMAVLSLVDLKQPAIKESKASTKKEKAPKPAKKAEAKEAILEEKTEAKIVKETKSKKSVKKDS